MDTLRRIRELRALLHDRKVTNCDASVREAIERVLVSFLNREREAENRHIALARRLNAVSDDASVSELLSSLEDSARSRTGRSSSAVSRSWSVQTSISSRSASIVTGSLSSSESDLDEEEEEEGEIDLEPLLVEAPSAVAPLSVVSDTSSARAPASSVAPASTRSSALPVHVPAPVAVAPVLPPLVTDAAHTAPDRRGDIASLSERRIVRDLLATQAFRSALERAVGGMAREVGPRAPGQTRQPLRGPIPPVHPHQLPGQHLPHPQPPHQQQYRGDRGREREERREEDEVRAPEPAYFQVLAEPLPNEILFNTIPITTLGELAARAAVTAVLQSDFRTRLESVVARRRGGGGRRHGGEPVQPQEQVREDPEARRARELREFQQRQFDAREGPAFAAPTIPVVNNGRAMRDLAAQVAQLTAKVDELTRLSRTTAVSVEDVRRAIAQEVSAALAANSAAPPAPVHELQPPRAPRSDRRAGGCIVCCDAEANTVFIGCGHVCACDGCAITVREGDSKCPVCRAYVRDTLRLYFA